MLFKIILGEEWHTGNEDSMRKLAAGWEDQSLGVFVLCPGLALLFDLEEHKGLLAVGVGAAAAGQVRVAGEA